MSALIDGCVLVVHQAHQHSGDECAAVEVEIRLLGRHDRTVEYDDCTVN